MSTHDVEVVVSDMDRVTLSPAEAASRLKVYVEDKPLYCYLGMNALAMALIETGHFSTVPTDPPLSGGLVLPDGTGLVLPDGTGLVLG